MTLATFNKMEDDFKVAKIVLGWSDVWVHFEFVKENDQKIDDNITVCKHYINM